MSKAPPSQLDKVLAMADSSHDGEAVVAVRKARQMLNRDGLSFADLARAAQHKPRVNLPFGFFSNQQVVNLETEILQLRQQVEDMRTERDALAYQGDLWRQKVGELEQRMNLSKAEAERWRKLARETVEKLWDLGQAIQQEDEQLPAENNVTTSLS